MQFHRGALALAGTLVLAIALAPGRAAAQTHEVYAHTGVGYFSSASRVLVGLGGGPGYRLQINPYLAAYAEARWLGYAGNAGSALVGAMGTLPVGHWRPGLGLQVASFFGDQIRVIDGANPDPPASVVLAIQARVAPLRFQSGRFTANALAVDFGWGPDRGGLGFALGVTFFEIGLRL